MRRGLPIRCSLSLLGTVLGLSLLLGLAGGRAQAAGGKSKKEQAQIAQKLAEGEEALKRKDLDAAQRIFYEVYRADPSPRTLYYLGAVAAARSSVVEARDLLRRFLADPNVEPTDPLRVEAQKLMEGLPVQPAGEVMVNAPRGALIEADGRLLGVAPLSLPLLLPSGAHQILVEQGKWKGSSDAKVPTGRQLEVRFKSGADVAIVTLPPGVILLDETPDAASGAVLGQVIEAALKRENFALVPRATALTYAPDLSGCLQQSACQQQLAGRFEADYVLQLRARRDGTSPAHWTLQLQLLDVESGVSAGEQRATCDSCTVEQAAQRLNEVTLALFRAAAGRPRGQVQITTEPAGAEVLLSGRSIGKAPIKREVLSGRYALEVRLQGYAPRLDTIEVQNGKPLRLAVNLEADGSEPSPRALERQPVVADGPPRRPVWRLATGGALIGAGVLVGGFGIGALLAAGKCKDLSPLDPNDPLGSCPSGRFDDGLQGVGIGLTVVGALAAAGGAVLIALPPSKSQGAPRKSDKAALRIDLRGRPGGASIALSGGF